MAPILINRAPWNALVDDPGNNLEGTPWTKDRIKTVLLDPIDVALADVDDGTTKDAAQDNQITNNTNAIAALQGVGSPMTMSTDGSSGAKNDFVLGGRGHDAYWQWDSGGADLNLTGIAGGVAGDRLTIKNAAGGNTRKITLAYLSSASASANRFFLPVTSAPTPIGPGGWATLVHYGGGWILVDHEQGSPLAAPFSAANFFGSAGAWAVAAGNLTQFTYKLQGKTLTVFITIESTNLAVAGQYLVILCAAYGGFLGVATTIWSSADVCAATAGAVEIAFSQIAPFYGLDRIAIFRPNTVNFPIGAIGVYQTATFAIQ
jgi:hypothetical protein